jgi:hypothetical protein
MITVYPDTPDTQSEVGGADVVSTHDELLNELLEQVLIELKITNIHNELITDSEIDEEDI